MATLIFESVERWDGTPVDPPHRLVINAKVTEFVHQEDPNEHTWLVLRRAGNHHEIARLYEIGAAWCVGNYSYDTLRIEA